MKENEFINNIKEITKTKTKEELNDIIIKLCQIIPDNLYFKTICIIENMYNMTINKYPDSIENSTKIINWYKRINDGEIVFQCYGRPDGTYSYYDENYEYYYYATDEMNEVLNSTYNHIVKLIYSKKYKESLTFIDLLLNTVYPCEEISDPTYSDYEEIIDVYDTEIYNAKNSLDFDLERLICFSVYAVLMANLDNKFEQIKKIVKSKYYDIRKCENIGIESVPNIEKVYNDWLKYNEQ